MGSGPRVAVIFLDGTDPESIARHMEAGWMPVLAKAFPQARKVGLQSLNELFPTSLWPCLVAAWRWKTTVSIIFVRSEAERSISSSRPSGNCRLRSVALDISDGKQPAQYGVILTY